MIFETYVYLEHSSIPPMVIAIWYGYSKPVLNEYLKTFVDELENLIPNGVSINGYRINIRFGLVISDTPARCMIKGTNFSSEIFIV